MFLDIHRIHQSPLSRYGSHNSNPSFTPNLGFPNDQPQNLYSSMNILVGRFGLERTDSE
jgi:hypothetical protein